jgi:NADH-quinone oxidoreductase subunit E
MHETASQTGNNSRTSDFQVKLLEYDGHPGALIPFLQSAQETFGYIPESAIDEISETLNVPVAEIYGVITFYSQFRLKPLGKYVIKLCDGTACHVNSSQTIQKAVEEELQISTDETTGDGLFSLQKVACLGCCSLSPVIMINDETHGRLTPKSVQQILRDLRKEETQSEPGGDA